MLGIQGQLGSAAVGFYQGPGSSISSIKVQKGSVSGLMKTKIVVYVVILMDLYGCLLG